MKLLIIANSPTTLFPFFRLLRALGIDYATARWSSSGLDTPAGQFAWSNSTGIRNYLRQYSAVIVFDSAALLNFTGDSQRTLAWLSWNDPADPPIAYLRVGTHGSIASANLPSDFPIIPPDFSNLDATAVRIHNATTGANFERHAGLRVRLEREGIELYVPTAMAATPGVAFYLYLLDVDKHNALGSNGEVLVRPVSEDWSFPTNTIAGYRYRKHYILPMLFQTSSILNFYSVFGMGYFWFLYALKLLGVQPRYAIPLFLVMDDALTVNNFAGGSGQPTRAQFASICVETYRYLAETFYPRTGGAMVCGLFMGGRYGRRSEPLTAIMQEHWNLVRNGQYWNGSAYVSLEPEAHAKIVEWHNLLLRHHGGGLPCTIHDHSIRHRQNRVWASFTRHSDDGFAYAAPNDVPKGAGTLIRKANYVGTPPAGTVERVIDGEVYYEFGMPTTGTGATFSNLDMRSLHGQRIAWESAVAEMRALGFPDAHGGEDYRLIISPNYLTGGQANWRVLKEIGYQLVRCGLPINNSTLATNEFDVEPVPATGVFEGLHFVGSLSWDCGAATGGTYGLYHTTQTAHTATSVYNLDLSADITGIWGSDRIAAAQRAYRRYVGLVTEQTLRGFATLTALPVCHPPAMLSWADPSDPTRAFVPDTGNNHINFLLEIAWNLEKVVNVLYPYLKWGTVKEYVAMRERLLST